MNSSCGKNCNKSASSELMKIFKSMSKKKESKRRSKSGSPKTDNQASQLLFINKDPQNLTRTPEEVYAIGSHVSKGSRKWKRAKSYLDLNTSTNRILGGSDSETEEATSAKPSPSAGKGLKLRWRMLDGRVTSTRTVGAKDFAKPIAASASASASAPTPALSNRPAMMSTRSSDSSTPATPAPSMPPPFQVSDEGHTKQIQSLLHVYFQRIRPAVFSLSRSWIWIDDFSLVISSPALTYAICAFVSAFTVGSQYGLDKLCLPPEARTSTQPQETTTTDTLWPMPEWFLFQAQAITLLRVQLQLSLPSDPSRPIAKPELHAILFLMRLHILLANQDAAQMHLSAITNATSHAAILPDLRIDIAMWKVNFTLALTHPSAIQTRPFIPAPTHTSQTPLLDIDLSDIPDPDERRLIQRLLIDRTILWTCTSPTSITVPNASSLLIQDHLLIDNDRLSTLSPSTVQTISMCLLIARYLLAYLRYIDADTTLGCIRQLVPELQTRLSTLLEPQTQIISGASYPVLDLWASTPNILLYLLFTGTFACRGIENEKKWFTRSLITGLEMGVFETLDDVTGCLGLFLEVETFREGLVGGVWGDLVREVEGGGGRSGGGDGGGSRRGAGSRGR